MGGRPSGGYGIEVLGVYVTGEAMYVRVQETDPRNCINLAVITSPVVAVRVPRSPDTVTFIEEVRMLDCQGQ